MPNSWIDAVKKWNSDKKSKKPDHKYLVPRKGTKEYQEVRKLMGNQSLPKVGKKQLK